MSHELTPSEKIAIRTTDKLISQLAQVQTDNQILDILLTDILTDSVIVDRIDYLSQSLLREITVKPSQETQESPAPQKTTTLFSNLRNFVASLVG